MLTGPSQFNKSYREKNLSKHRFWGHVYFCCTRRWTFGLGNKSIWRKEGAGQMGMTVLSSLWFVYGNLGFLSHIQ